MKEIIKNIASQVIQTVGSGKFEINKWQKLDRFLLLGTCDSKYDVLSTQLNIPNEVVECVKEDGVRVVDRIVEISKQGRAFKNEPAILALAYCMKKGELPTRRAASAALNQVCRTGTHLFQFCNYVGQFGGWGKIVHRSLQNWYIKKNPKDLGYQMMKYQSREGWSHGDVLSKARPKPQDETYSELFKWAVHKTKFESRPDSEPLARIWAMQQASGLSREDSEKAIQLIHEFDLPREATPTWFRNDPAVQAALLEHMPMTAMIRNLGGMTASGMFDKYPQTLKLVTERLSNQEWLMASRVHPMAVLQALAVYQQGRGDKGSLAWKPFNEICIGLERAFYATFQNVVPTNQRFCLALDVSGSMTAKVNGLNMSCRDASAAMALVTVARESRTSVIGFSAGDRSWSYITGDRSRPLWVDDKLGVCGLDISPTRRLPDVINYISGLGFTATDCAAPILWALKENREFDVFVVYTDSETNSHKIEPYKALQEYRQRTGIPARLVVVAMINSRSSIANPNDPGMLDIVGCDTATPRLISEFALARI